MFDEKIRDVIDVLSAIEKDFSVPKNVRIRIKNAYSALEKNTKSIEVRIDQSLQELDDISDDPNIPVYARTQIWNVVCMLESISE